MKFNKNPASKRKMLCVYFQYKIVVTVKNATE